MRPAMWKAAAASPRLLVALALALAFATTSAIGTAADTKPPAQKTAPAEKRATQHEAGDTAPVSPQEAIQQLVEGEDVRGFRAFCDGWMAKLRERTTYNVAHVAWTTSGPTVVGEYLGYGTERTCVAREEPGKDPIGKITYRETKYRKEGPTESAAMGAAGTIVEQTDVTEIFRYAKGRWQY